MESATLKLILEHLGMNKETYLLTGIFLSYVVVITQQKVRNTKVDGKFDTQNEKINNIKEVSYKAEKESSEALDISKDTKRLVENIGEDVSKINDHVNSIGNRVESVIISLEEKYERYERREERGTCYAEERV